MDTVKHFWDSRNANLGLECPYHTLKCGPIFLRCYQTSPAQTDWTPVHGRSLLWIMICGIQRLSASSRITVPHAPMCLRSNFAVHEQHCHMGARPLAARDDPRRSDAFAASLSKEDRSPHHNLDGDVPALGHLLAHSSPAVPASRRPARSRKIWTYTFPTLSTSGDWPV